MGLPGSGKTTLANELKKYLEAHELKIDWFNADDIRRKFNDWDFSKEGRIRQSLRMLDFALESTGDFVICDFIAPYPEMRDNFSADYTIYMDTIDYGRYEDTNQAFVKPDTYDFRITEYDALKWARHIGQHIMVNECF